MRISKYIDPITFLLDHPFRLLLFLLLLLTIYNWQWPLAVFRDAKRRNIRHKMFWTLLVFLTAGWGLPLYDAWAKRPQTLLSSTPIGMIIGKSITKTPRKIQLAMIIIILIVPVLSLSSILKKFHNMNNMLASNDAINLILFTLIFPMLISTYLIFSYLSKGRINPLDQPLWGMKITNAGLIDESLTKHKRAVILLTVFILLLPFLFILYIIISKKLGY